MDEYASAGFPGAVGSTDVTHIKLEKVNYRFCQAHSPEKKVQIELLDLLRKLRIPLKAFTVILKWAAKSNASGCVFHEGFQPTYKKAIPKL